MLAIDESDVTVTASPQCSARPGECYWPAVWWIGGCCEMLTAVTLLLVIREKENGCEGRSASMCVGVGGGAGGLVGFVLYRIDAFVCCFFDFCVP